MPDTEVERIRKLVADTRERATDECRLTIDPDTLRLCDAVEEAMVFIGNDTVAPTLGELATMDEGALASRITRKTKARLMCARIRRILEGSK